MRHIFLCLLLYKLSIVNISSGYDDISANKSTNQGIGITLSDYSSNAVDGSLSTCSSTDASNPAWWYVDLGKVKSIYDVEIYFRLYEPRYEQRQRERMYGYKLYISNSTDFSLLHEAYLCYSHTGPELPELNFTHVCVSFGRFVIFYNERVPVVTYPGNQRETYTQLCEVIVQGCEEDGVYGNNCNKTCRTNCQERRCYITNGTCVGCKDGWIGEQCIDVCSFGSYGAECKKKCSKGCRNNSCNHVTGHCDGCRPGWMGRDCNEVCRFGTYGENCMKNCSGNCAKEEYCNKESGNCDNGCTHGYKGTKCEQECGFGTYGPDCSKFCSGNCHENKTCAKVNGKCMNGCRIGFNGTLCNETCKIGTFGLNCSGICSNHCVNKTCNYVTGSCNYGCIPGWRDDKCDERCNNGTFGVMCKEKCSGTCFNNTCNHVNGHCTHGCQAGYQGDKCHIPCIKEHFGKNCSQKCSVKCHDVCDNVNGHCKCNKGWMGRNCSEACSSGHYGYNCEERCSSHCLNNEPCNIVNGSCPSGCQEGYEGDTCQQIKGSFTTSETNEENATYGVVGGVVAVVVIVLVVVVVYIWRRKARTKEHDKSQQTLEFVVHNTNEDKLSHDGDGIHSNENEILKRTNQSRKRRCIQIKDFWKITRNLSRQENAGFKDEYMEIPKGELHPCEVGQREENKDKNRYTTTFPYDHTRVILQESNKNDGYINANYIKDLSGEKKYIATQGPRKKTITDFWEMVWQEEVTTIVCLTNLKEGTREKCKQYWPNNSEKIQHGHITIRNNEEKTYANYVTRKFHVQNIAENKERDILMFHYTQWTDHGVPEALNLVIFHRHFLRSFSRNSLQHKLLVHCSAGIGRTGTFIALDALYRDGLNQGSVNVQEYVTQMRHDRMNMVQGEEQYKMVYAALYESFRGDLRPVDADTFLSQYQNSSCYVNLGEVANKKTPVEDQFKELSSLNPHNTAKYGKLGASFNDSEEKMSGEKYKCYVLSDDEKSVQYNAVVLQSFAKPDGIISASYPTENQCEDFLYVVRGSGASTVVFLGKLSDISSTKFWFPTKNDTKVVGSFTVKMRICTPSDSFMKTNIIIQKKGFKDVAVSVLECNFWKEDTVTADCQKVLEVIAEARLEETAHPKSRLLVLSSDGAKRCGPFCVAYNAIEQLILDKEVDIFTATRLIQIRRPDMVSTTEEYQFCHGLIAEYLQNHMVYANYSS